MVTGRTHRMTELFGRLAPGASSKRARRADCGPRRDDGASTPRRIRRRPMSRLSVDAAPRSDCVAGADDPARAARRRGGRLRDCVLERRQPDPGAIGAPRRRAGGARRARREPRRTPADAAGREPGPLRRRRRARAWCWQARLLRLWPAIAARFSVRALEVTVDPGLLWVGAGLAMAAAVLLAFIPRLPSPQGLPASAWRAAASGSRRAPTAACAIVRDDADSVFVRAARRRRACSSPRSSRCRRRRLATTCVRCWRSTSRRQRRACRDVKEIDFQSGSRRAASASCPEVEGVAIGSFVPWRDAGSGSSVSCSPSKATRPRTAKRIRARGSASSRRDFFAVLGVPMLAGREFTDEDRRGSEPVAIVSQSVAQRLFPGRRRDEPAR